MDRTIIYYNKNASTFFASTYDVDFQKTQDIFLSHLASSASYILDFGCGSGRDTKYFLERGYTVEAWDGSEELCSLASKLTGITVKNKLFSELVEKEKYDGIWACSSILHLPLSELIDVFIRIQNALKSQGIVYTSFKYGEFSGYKNGRYFTDMTEASFELLARNLSKMKCIKSWITGDVRPNRGEEKWLNLLLQKV